MARFSILAVAALLVLPCVVSAQEGWEDVSTDPNVLDTRSQLEDISLLNLVNGLQLSSEQMERIIALSRDAQDLRRRTFEAHAAAVRDFHETLARLRDVLISSHPHPDRALEESAQQQEGRIHEARRNYFAELREIEARLREVLSSGQVRVAEEFNPCLIPPRELRDPVRVGQPDSEFGEVAEGVDGLRWVPDSVYEGVRDAYLEIAVRMEERMLGGFGPGAREEELARLRGIADRARAMADADYAVHRDEVALEVIQPITRFQESAREVQQFFVGAEGGLTKVGKYLLNPRVVPLLEARLAAPEMETAERDGEGPEAPSCERCAAGHRAAGERPETIENKPRFEELVAYLGLEGDAVEETRRILAEGQIEMLETLTRTRDDGRNILKEFLVAATSQGESNALMVLGETAPGENRSYLLVVTALQARTMGRLQDALAPETFRRLARANVDLFGVKLGDLRPYAYH